MAKLLILFEQIWPDLGDWNEIVKSLIFFFPGPVTFEQIWPDLGDWNFFPTYRTVPPLKVEFEQIWPDLGDWNKSFIK